MGIQDLLNSATKVGRADASIGVQNRGQIDRTGGFGSGGAVYSRDATPNPNGGPAAARGGSFPATLSGGPVINQLVQAADVVYIGPVAQGNDFASLAEMQQQIVNGRALTRSKCLKVIFADGAANLQTWDGSVNFTDVGFEILEFVSSTGTIIIEVQNGTFNNTINLIIGDDIVFRAAAGLGALIGGLVTCVFVTGKSATLEHPDNGGIIFAGGTPFIEVGDSATVQAGQLGNIGELVGGGGSATFCAPKGAATLIFNATFIEAYIVNVQISSTTLVFQWAILINVTINNATTITINSGLVECVTWSADTIDIDVSALTSCLSIANSSFTAGTALNVTGNPANAFNDNVMVVESAFDGNGGPIDWNDVNRPVGCSFIGFTVLTIVASNFSPTNCQFDELGGDVVVNSSAAGVGVLRSQGNLWQANRVDIGLDNGAANVVAPFGNAIFAGDRIFTSVPAFNVAGNEGGTFTMSDTELLTGAVVGGVVAPANARFDNAVAVNVVGIANLATNLTGGGATNLPNATNV